jgi:hypothetical protein
MVCSARMAKLGAFRLVPLASNQPAVVFIATYPAAIQCDDLLEPVQHGRNQTGPFTVNSLCIGFFINRATVMQYDDFSEKRVFSLFKGHAGLVPGWMDQIRRWRVDRGHWDCVVYRPTAESYAAVFPDRWVWIYSRPYPHRGIFHGPLSLHWPSWR